MTTKNEAIRELERVGVPKNDIRDIESDDIDNADDELMFYLNDSDGFEYECSTQICSYSGFVVAWNAYVNDDEGNLIGAYTYTSLQKLCDGVNEIRS